jgi:hypothetical protein
VNLQGTNQVLLTNTAIHNNTLNGVALSSAPGTDAANVDELSPVTDDQYGFRIRTTPSSSAKVPVYSNGGAGFSVGTAGQTSTIVAKIGDVAIHHNGGVGIDVRQNSSLGAGAECTGDNGCTGVTMLSNEIYANTGGGIRLRTAFIKRLLGGSEQRGFAGNSVFHNALNQCGGTQTASQIVVDGPTGLDNGDCAGLNVTECAEANIPTESSPNNQCVFLGSSCVVAWDLSSSPTSCGLANSFRDYDRTGAPEVNRKGAIFATNGARVLANNNNWPLQSPVENVDYSFSADGNTIIVAGQGCSSTGATCSEPPPAPAP